MSLPISPRTAVSLYKHTIASPFRTSSRHLSRLQHSQLEQHSSSASAVAVRLLSTTKRNGTSSLKSNSDQKRPFDDQVEPPKASFRDLGASRTVKVVVIVALMVFGTMESIFWMRVLWEKFGSSPTEEQKESKVGSKPA